VLGSTQTSFLPFAHLHKEKERLDLVQLGLAVIQEEFLENASLFSEGEGVDNGSVGGGGEALCVAACTLAGGCAYSGWGGGMAAIKCAAETLKCANCLATLTKKIRNYKDRAKEQADRRQECCNNCKASLYNDVVALMNQCQAEGGFVGRVPLGNPEICEMGRLPLFYPDENGNGCQFEPLVLRVGCCRNAKNPSGPSLPGWPKGASDTDGGKKSCYSQCGPQGGLLDPFY
jgi:hypothetical protein